MKCDDEMINKQILKEQQIHQIENTFFETVQEMCKEHEVDLNKIAEMKKSELKAIIKSKVNEKMLNIISEEKLLSVMLLKGLVFSVVINEYWYAVERVSV